MEGIQNCDTLTAKGGKLQPPISITTSVYSPAAWLFHYTPLGEKCVNEL